MSLNRTVTTAKEVRDIVAAVRDSERKREKFDVVGNLIKRVAAQNISPKLSAFSLAYDLGKVSATTVFQVYAVTAGICKPDDLQSFCTAMNFEFAETIFEKVVDSLVRQLPDDGSNKTAAGKKPRKPTADQLMKAALASNIDEVKGLTAAQWADKIGKGETTVKETETWKNLQLLRADTKAKNAMDRRKR